MSKPKFTPLEDGPLLVEGLSEIVRYADGKRVAIEGRVALCRCGGSSNKPFCDGTHKRNGFSSAKSPDRVPDRLDRHQGKGLTVLDNRGLCAHAGRCTDGLPIVFRLGTEPWIDPNGADAEAIAKTIEQCPSGALSYEINGRVYRDRGGEPSAAFAPNGPYVLRGGIELSGSPLNEGGTMDHMALCRCGQSKNKPFCSGAHWNVSFDEDSGR